MNIISYFKINKLNIFIPLVFISGCNSDSNNSIEENLPIVSIEKSSQTLREGKTHKLTAHIKPNTFNIKNIRWEQTNGESLTFLDPNSQTTRFTLPISDVKNNYFKVKAIVTIENGIKIDSFTEFNSYKGMSKIDASNLLNQASLGFTYEDIIAAENLDEEEWIDSQLTISPTLHSTFMFYEDNSSKFYHASRINAWWNTTLKSKDLLRQKVAFALSQIFVVSDINTDILYSNPAGMINFYDMLIKNSFNNFRLLLSEISLSPIMGNYLNHLGNKKSNKISNIRPDENFARELMQLFTIGLVLLNQDGSEKLNHNNETISTYGQKEIANFARVFTGWNYANATYWKWPYNFTEPMEPWEEFHDNDEKILLNGTVLPAGQSAQQDLDQALDNLFYHPNVPPFISKQLIQRLVTSNPTPQYVKRVADVFTDNGEGVRGDLAAVIKAILLDDEARNPSGVLQYSGKIREPLLRTVQFWRELKSASASDWFYTWRLNSTHGQIPLGSPSVFNFFRPDYQPPELQVWQSTSPFNSSLNTHLVAPELQIANDATLIGQFNHQYFYSLWRIKELSNDPHENTILLSLQHHVDRLNSQGLDALLDHYDVLFFSGRMSTAMRQTLVNTHNIFANWSDYEKVGYLLFTISVSPEYVLQH